jgi:hypothetical protein
MKQWLGCLAVAAGVVFAGAEARAGSIMFTYDSLAAGSTTQQIENYMTGVYGSTVTVNQAHVEVNHGSSNATNWPGNSTPYLTTHQAATMSISFVNVPISSFTSDAHIFRGNDMDVTGFDSMGNVVGSHTYMFSGKPPDTFSIGLTFGSPVTTLSFSDSGFNDVGIDNLSVAGPSLPEPSTLVLCGLGGVMLAGWRRYRRVPA